MNSIESLSDLFESVGCKATFFDLGVRIRKFTPQEVIQFDRKQMPYPAPYNHHASLAILLQPLIPTEPTSIISNAPEQTQVSIWFVRFPIDEKGTINLGTRDHFIKSIIDKILHKDQQTEFSNILEDNPYIFKPDDERLANFHAITNKLQQNPASSFFQPVVDYLSQEINDADEAWQNLGLQGIADLAVRFDEPMYRKLIVKAIAQGPTTLAIAVAKSLEHQSPDTAFVAFVVEQFRQATDMFLKVALIRSISNTDGDEGFNRIIQLSLLSANKAATNDQLELVITLITKCPHWLVKDHTLMTLCLENLSQRDDGFAAFTKVVSEMAHSQILKNPLKNLLRQQHTSGRLSQAISALFQAAPEQVQ